MGQDSVKVLEGWFFCYRGNGYGPFKTKEDAIRARAQKSAVDHERFLSEVLSPFQAKVEVADRKLIDIKIKEAR